MNHTQRLRFGLVGCGAIGPTHAGALRQLQDDAELVAVCDIVPQRASDLAAKFSVPKVHPTIEAMLVDDGIDAVIFATPSGMHSEQAIATMNAGKHVVVEKPLDVSLAAADAMIAASDRAGKKAAVISQHRFDHATKVIRDTIDSGVLGKIVLADASVKWWRTQQYYDSGDWRGTWAMDGGGCLMNQGVHTVDLLLWLAGPVKRVSALMRTAGHERIEVEDVVTATCEFASGAIGTITASTAAYSGLPARLDLFGTEGCAILEGDRLKMLRTKDGRLKVSQAASAHAESVAAGGTASVKDETAKRLGEAAAADPGEVWGDAHREQLRDFIAAVRDDRPPLVDAREGRKAIELILAIYDSARRGGEWVEPSCPRPR